MTVPKESAMDMVNGGHQPLRKVDNRYVRKTKEVMMELMRERERERERHAGTRRPRERVWWW